MIGTSLIALTEKARVLVEAEEIQLDFCWNGDITVMALDASMDNIIRKKISRQPFIQWRDFNDTVNAMICRLAA